MRNILTSLLIVSILWGMISVVSPLYSHPLNEGEKQLLHARNILLPDSSDCIFFSFGYHGRNWSIIISDSSGLKIHNGTTMSYPESSYVLHDTARIINDNIRIIKWGLDTLPILSDVMKPNIKKENFGGVFGWGLEVARQGDVCFEKYNYNSNYSGPDSIAFNEKLGGLWSLMFWIAFPDRKRLPFFPNDSKIYNQP